MKKPLSEKQIIAMDHWRKFHYTKPFEEKHGELISDLPKRMGNARRRVDNALADRRDAEILKEVWD